MSEKKFKFIVYAPSFSEVSGGRIALHRLCDLLHQNGEEAYVWKYYYDIPKFEIKKPIKSIYRILKHIKYEILLPYETNKSFYTPIANKDILDENCIVIYPEIVSGNPLNAKHVVRWFLHKPGFHTGIINYGENELYFFYQAIFNDKNINPHEDHLLTVSWVRDDVYRQTNYEERKGSCYMIRKGKGRMIVHDLKESIRLDGKSHTEVAQIMNQCEYFISYDMQTMYSQFAVLCGCKSIVIPEDDMTKEEWQPKPEYRYGIAYGFDDIQESEQTKHLLYNYMKEEEQNSNKSVKNFIKKVYEVWK